MRNFGILAALYCTVLNYSTVNCIVWPGKLLSPQWNFPVLHSQALPCICSATPFSALSFSWLFKRKILYAAMSLLYCLLAAPQRSTTTCSTVSASLWNYTRSLLITEIDGVDLFSGPKNLVGTCDGLCGLHMGHDQGYRPGKGRNLLISTL